MTVVVNTQTAGGGGGSSLAISSSHVFADNTARDAYFTAHAAEKVVGVLIAVGAGFQEWDGASWVDKTAVVQGPAGTGSGDMTLAGSQTVSGSKLFTTAQTFQPATDVMAITARRSSSGATADIQEWQTEANAVLSKVGPTGAITAPDFTTTGQSVYMNTGQTVSIKAGTGSPEGVVTAAVGSIWLRTDGGANTSMYRKETGAGNTGWVDLSGKADVLSVVTLGSGTTAITHAAHANRPGIVNQAGATTGTFAATATSGAIAGDAVEILNIGAGTFTASGAISAAAGFKLTAATGEVFSAVYSAAADAWYSATPDTTATGTGATVRSTRPTITGIVSKVASLPTSNDTADGTVITGLSNGYSGTIWDPVYLGAAGAWLLADADGSGTYPCRGLACATASSAAVDVLTLGVARHDAWNWTIGGNIYYSTAGALTQTAPSGSGNAKQAIGFAVTADSIFVNCAAPVEVLV